MEVKAILAALGFATVSDREITANVLASCDEVAENRTEAFGDRERDHRQLPRHPGIAGLRADGVGCVGVPDRPLAAARMTSTRVDAWMLPVVPGAADDPAFVAVIGTDDAARISRLGRRADRDRAVCARVAARAAIGRRLGDTRGARAARR